jgi:DNA polymerase-3 subunit gamma/tau
MNQSSKAPLEKISTASQALYTKYRPYTFADVIGQDQIVKSLEESIRAGMTTHAYIFSGSRGTGKTSVARIFARELETHAHDLYEIDAASHTGVDTIRELLESVQTLPYQSKFKVYIFDEVHMLSKSAFNALLKTLEEPPAHVKFILATTEPEKIPETVRSRCEMYSFVKPSQDVLTQVVKNIAKKEKVIIEKGVAELVALAGNGSFRDTLSVFQKIIRTADADTQKAGITTEVVAQITGLPSTVQAMQCVEFISQKDVPAIVRLLEELAQSQKNMTVFTDLVSERMRAGLLMRLGAYESKTSSLSSDEEASLKTIVEKEPRLFSSKALLIMLNSYEYHGTALLPQLACELACIDIVEMLQG